MSRAALRPVKNVPFFLKKITPKFVTEAIGEINLLEMPRPVEAQELYQIFGHVRHATVVADKSGTKKDSVRFSGKFKAFTPPDANGEQYIFESGQTFIPVLDEYLYSTLKSAQEVEPGAYLEIAFSVGLKPAAAGKPSMTGYEWEVQKLIAQAPNPDDPIERLRAEAQNQALRLAGPADSTSKESVAETNGAGASEGVAAGSASEVSQTEASAPEQPKRRGRHATEASA